ncbi:MAG: MBOAT family protein [Planctomycetes bacterium]|nr:MBOAT family protein [Planctomycetota bacterium]
MNFVSFSFLFLLAVVLVIRMISDRYGLRNTYLVALLIASMVFYGWFVPIYLVLILFSSAVDFVAGRQLALDDRPKQRRLWLTASLVANLGLLGTFKYFDFFLENLEGLGQSLIYTGIILPRLDVILPIGISFYTFQSMSYTIDIYRGEIKPVKRFWKFLLYVSLFPQLVAGPIVRAKDFLYQIGRIRRIRLSVWSQGLYLMIQGFFLKMVIADHCGAMVDEYWAQGVGSDGNGFMSLYTTVLFSMQIFCDFAGYTNIARGVAYLLGFRLPINFNSPYVAASFSEFWRRWHITLSTWLRDYLYISLGGNRKGTARTYANLLIVMLLGGLWHGAANTFVIWGAIHGGALAIERLLGLNRGRHSLVVKLGWAVVVQAVVIVAWIFFRSNGTAQAVAILTSIFTGPYEMLSKQLMMFGSLLIAPVAMLHLRTVGVERLRLPKPSPTEKGFWAAIMFYFIVTGHATNETFIYFQF